MDTNSEFLLFAAFYGHTHEHEPHKAAFLDDLSIDCMFLTASATGGRFQSYNLNGLTGTVGKGVVPWFLVVLANGVFVGWVRRCGY